MSHQTCTSAEDTSKLKILPVYTTEQNPHEHHNEYVTKIRDGEFHRYYDFFCEDCGEEYIVKRSYGELLVAREKFLTVVKRY